LRRDFANIHAPPRSRMNTGDFAPPAWNQAIIDSKLHTFRTTPLWTACTLLKTNEIKSLKFD
jgi:hypothetical protein